MNVQVTEPQPFVGPQPFGKANTIYGRDFEISELRYYLGAKRIVLLHSPSGAGKSSLLQAKNGLLAKLQETRRYEVWGPARVKQGPVYEVQNRFAWSVISDFEKSRPEGARDARQFANTTLLEYLRDRKPQRSPVLVLDQFEEILRIDTTPATRSKFFEQLSELLYEPSVWALLVIREDYLAALTPHARQLPTHLLNRYRIDLLRREDQAVDAIAKPLSGRTFAPGVAEEIARDLASGGDYVEPLQLQVVCSNLWERIAARDVKQPITRADAGKIDDALATYYRQKVTRSGDPGGERQIRDWFDETLISAAGARNLVREEDLGIPLPIAVEMVNTYLVRREPRAGGSLWYELAHDRLVEPVRFDNKAWRESHLSPLQRAAELWEDRNRSKDLLLRGSALSEAREWARKQTTLRPVERDLLAESRTAQLGRRILFGLSAGAFLMAIVATVLFFQANQAKREAINSLLEAQSSKEQAECNAEMAAHQSDRARAREIEATEQRGRADHEATAAIASLARADVNAAQAAIAEQRPDSAAAYFAHALRLNPKDDLAARDAMGLFVTNTWFLTDRPLPYSDKMNGVFFNDDGTLLATTSDDATVRVWNVETRKAVSPPLPHDNKVTWAGFQPRGGPLLTIDGRARLWDSDWKQTTLPYTGVTSAAFEPNGAGFVLGLADGTAKILDASGVELASLRHGEPVTEVLYGPLYVATAGKKDAVTWEKNGITVRGIGAPDRVGLAFAEKGETLLVAHRTGVVAYHVRDAKPKATFAPGTRSFASAGWVATGERGVGVSVWDASGKRFGDTFLPKAYIDKVRISAGGTILATMNFPCQCARLIGAGPALLGPPILHSRIADGAINVDGSAVATIGGNAVRIWHAVSPADNALVLWQTYNHERYIGIQNHPAILADLLELVSGMSIASDGKPSPFEVPRRYELRNGLQSSLKGLNKEAAQEVQRFLQ